MIGALAACAAIPLAWRQVSLQKRTIARPGEDQDTVRAVGDLVAVPAGSLPLDVRGRDELLTRLHRLRRKRAGAVVILAGMGGVGKSTVAAAFADQVQRSSMFRRRTEVWWVPAVDRDRVTAALVTIARRMGGARADVMAIGADLPDAPDRFWELLHRTRRRWLLVFDNADQPELLGPVLRSRPAASRTFGSPSAGTGWVRVAPRGMVVVTSRDSRTATWGRHGKVIRMELPDERDAMRILCDRAPHAGDPADARELARRLGCLPLALHIVGTYLGSDVARFTSFRDYRRMLDAPTSAPVSAAGPADTDMIVMRTWEISLDGLDRSGISQGRALLRLLSCFASAVPIPRSLLAPGPLGGLLGSPDRPAQPNLLHHALSRLNDLGLVDVLARAEPAFVVHPVVADTNRAHLRASEDAACIGHVAVELLVSAVASLEHERIADWPAFLTFGPHIHALLELVVPVIDRRHLDTLVNAIARTARAYNLCGAVPAGEHLMRATVAALAQLDPDDPILLAARQELAWPIASLGHPAEAEAMYLDVLVARRRVLGEAHPETLRTWHEVAWTTAVQRRFAEAEAEYVRVLELRRRILGREHPDTLLTQHELGWVIANQSRTAEAVSILQEVLEIRQRVLGEGHLRTIKTHHELAWITALQGEWAQAEAKYQNLLSRAQEVLGAEHPDVLTFRHELAWVLAERNGRRPALREYRAVLDIRRRILGDSHPDTLATKQALERLRADEVIHAWHVV